VEALGRAAAVSTRVTDGYLRVDQVGDRAAIKAAVETYLSDHLEK